MADALEQVNAIISERSDLRSEIIQMVKSMHQAAFALVTVSVMMAGLYLKKDIITDENSRMPVLFFLTQVLVFLQFVLVVLTANHNVHAGYIEALERKLNSIFKSTVSIWEHEINRKYMVSPLCSFALSLMAIDIFILALQIVFIVVALTNGCKAHGIVLIIEIAVALALLLNSFLERKRVSKFATGLFKV